MKFDPRVLKALAFRMGTSYLEGHPEIILSAAQRMLMRKMRHITQTDLIRAIQDDTRIIANVNLAAEKGKFANILSTKEAQKLIAEYKDEVNGPLVLEWLRMERGDLAGVIINYPSGKGLDWLDRQVQDIKDGLFGTPIVPSPMVVVRPMPPMLKLTPKRAY